LADICESRVASVTPESKTHFDPFSLGASPLSKEHPLSINKTNKQRFMTIPLEE